MKADDQLLRRRTTTAPQTGFFSGSGPGQSMPADMVDQISRRVWAVGLVTAGLWTFSLVMNGVVAPLLGRRAIFEDLWPLPDLPVAVAGLLLSLVLIFLSRRVRHRPQLLLDLSAGFLILFCLLGGILSQWHPPPISPRISWLSLLIIAYPAIVPTTVRRTLVISLIAASMDPVGLFIAWLRGASFEPSAMYFAWDFLPTYIAALISVVPAKVIRQLSQQVMKARELGSYRLEEILGKGGMGEVYRASHQMLARPAAIKLIRSEVLGESAPDRARVMIERFRREAQASASLRSPHTINLYDFGVSQDGTFFLVMEMLEGLDLETLVQRFGPQSAERTVYLLQQACESLAEAHSRGLIHRDIKPSNIFVCRMGLAVDFVKVLDFGLVKALDEDKQSTMLTAPDATAGTPAFMPPEVVLGKGPVDHRVDIYALGCVAYWLLTGKLVFEAPNAMQVMIQHANVPPVAPSKRVELPIPPALDQVVLACLAKDPADRPATATELGERLVSALNGSSWSQDQAQRWWERHRPEAARQVQGGISTLTLEKAVGPGWSLGVLLFLAGWLTPHTALGQTGAGGESPPAATVTRPIGARYSGGFLRRFFLGRDYRDLWAQPVTVPVLDLATFAGGLTPISRGGGKQTTSIRLHGADGRDFYFRSIDKDPSPNLPPELRNTIADAVIQDQTSSAHPTAPLVVAGLLDAAGVLHGEPMLFVLPDDERLGEFRKDYAGLIGMLEPRVAPPAPGEPSWGGATEIIGGDELFDRVTRSPDDRVDARAFLRARLVDLLVGDWDRHRDQWAWVRFGEETPRRWLPVPRDRDFAMVSYDGVFLYIGRNTLPQLITFRNGYPSILGLTWNGRELDRRFLMDLSPAEWDAIVAEVRGAITDSVIEQAVRRMPPQHFAINGERTIQILESRRDQLPEIAGKFYRMLARQAEVYATDADEIARLEATDDTLVELALYRKTPGGQPGEPYLRREFSTRDTPELRVFLHGGDDSAVVVGPLHGMTVRVVGDSGADALIDSSGVHWARMYDHDRGTVVSRGVKLDRRPYLPPAKRTPNEIPARDWGSRWTPTTSVILSNPDVGLFVGGGRTLTVYGFRKHPFASRHDFRAGIATGPWTYRADYTGEWRKENSRSYAQIYAKASGIETLRFGGFGNEIAQESNGAPNYFRVTSDQYSIEPSYVLALGTHLQLSTGPLARLVRTDANKGRFIAQLDPYGTGDFGEVGARGVFTFDTRNRPIAATTGVLVSLGGSVYPGIWDVRRTYGRLFGEASTYLTAHVPLDPTLALRVGGKKVFGPYPYFDAASIGGTGTVRLGRENKYAGDAAAFASTELRLTLARQILGSSFDVGVFGLGDVGRVFLEGEHSDKWHSAGGGGAWIFGAGAGEYPQYCLGPQRTADRLLPHDGLRDLAVRCFWLIVVTAPSPLGSQSC